MILGSYQGCEQGRVYHWETKASLYCVGFLFLLHIFPSFLFFCFPGLLVFTVIGGVNLFYWPDGICSVRFLQFVSSLVIKLGGVLLKVNNHHIDICVFSGGCIPINWLILNMMEHNKQNDEITLSVTAFTINFPGVTLHPQAFPDLIKHLLLVKPHWQKPGE